MTQEIQEKLKILAREINSLLPSLYLAGGTGIMIKYAHRVSKDLDFFSKKIGLAAIETRVLKKFSQRIDKAVHFPDGDNIDFFIDGIRVSFVRFPFDNVLPVELAHGVRLASDLDILLNKIYAAGRRIESKDPFDIAFLLSEHPIWNKTLIEEKFRKKFKEEKFAIYFSAVISFEDYPGLSKQSRDILSDWYGKN